MAKNSPLIVTPCSARMCSSAALSSFSTQSSRGWPALVRVRLRVRLRVMLRVRLRVRVRLRLGLRVRLRLASARREESAAEGHLGRELHRGLPAVRGNGLGVRGLG